MSINAVGVGSLVYKKEAEMRKIAGTDGKVFLYADFALLTSHFDEIMESACSKFLLLLLFLLLFVLYHVLLCYSCRFCDSVA